MIDQQAWTGSIWSEPATHQKAKHELHVLTPIEHTKFFTPRKTLEMRPVRLGESMPQILPGVVPFRVR
jgi:hypothetical protein